MGITCKYEIHDLKDTYYPNDEISGIFIIESDEEKDKKLKNVEIHLVISFSRDVESVGGRAHYSQYGNIGHEKGAIIIKKYNIAKGDIIKPGEVIKYDFNIKLPNQLIPQAMSMFFFDCDVSLWFMQKTGRKLSRGSDEDSAICAIKVSGSVGTASSSGAPSIQEGSADTKFCFKCGKKVRRDAKFCEHCGVNLDG